jgi:hypothetical protein
MLFLHVMEVSRAGVHVRRNCSCELRIGRVRLALGLGTEIRGIMYEEA